MAAISVAVDFLQADHRAEPAKAAVREIGAALLRALGVDPAIAPGIADAAAYPGQSGVPFPQRSIGFDAMAVRTTSASGTAKNTCDMTPPITILGSK